MEPIDLPIPAFGPDGVLRPVGKLAVHRQGLRHPAVSVFVLRGAEILIQQRAAGKYHTPGLWANTCCTHPMWGETAADCAVRRLSEELGISELALRHVGQ
ncbi:MAG: NUDIX domain-containing protein, partial [Tabrizicola sp.]